jgi:signal transduction histidine kinase
LEQGGSRKEIFCLLEGEVTQYKRATDGKRIAVDVVREGDLVGLLSYCTGNPNFTDSVAKRPVKALAMDYELFGSLAQSAPALYERLQTLIRDNLTQRYRRMVELHLEVATVNAELERERDALRSTVHELEATRSRLAHQEKMAVLGRLVAGLAHEINNPAAAVLRSVDYLKDAFEEVLEGVFEDDEGESARHFWNAGMCAELPDTATQRERLDALVETHPRLPRSLLRRLAGLPPEVLALAPDLSPESLGRLLPVFESGLNLQTIQVSSERIQNLVVNLKKYARPGSNGEEEIDLREGIRETLLILRSALKPFQVELDLPEIPKVKGDSGKLNQVWTNLIYNACEAMGREGRLRVCCGQDGAGRVFVEVEDNGPGISPELKEKIFEPNFTTKQQANHFGLGLGLGISRDIVRDHGGELSVIDAPDHGAIFRVELPVRKQD